MTHLLAIAAVVLAFCAAATAFSPTLAAAKLAWDEIPDYSHGYLVAPFVLFLIWRRRQQLRKQPIQPSAAGFVLFGAAIGLEFMATRYFIPALHQGAFLAWVASLAWILGGWRWLVQLLPAIAFLFLLFPLPFSIETYLSGPLQRIATLGSCFLLELANQNCTAEGNVLLVGEHRLEVAQACSGLRMFVASFALCAGFALLEDLRPNWQRWTIVLLAFPIAIFCNILRVATTGLLYQYTNTQWVQSFSHDAAGWAMMPCALALLGIALWYMDRAFGQATETTPQADRPPAPLLPRPATQMLVYAIAAGGITLACHVAEWGRPSANFKIVKAEQLSAMPTSLAGWEFAGERTMSPDAERILRRPAHFIRSYRKKGSSELITAVVLLGDPGPVSLHDPNICYSTAGFLEIQAPTRERMLVTGKPVDFWTIELQASNPLNDDLRILWGWNAGAGWEAPRFARFYYGGVPYLLKIQIVSQLGSTPDANQLASFLEVFLPALSQQLGVGISMEQ